MKTNTHTSRFGAQAAGRLGRMFTLSLCLAVAAASLTACGGDDDGGGWNGGEGGGNTTDVKPAAVLNQGLPANVNDLNCSYDAQGRLTQFGEWEFSYTPNSDEVVITQGNGYDARRATRGYGWHSVLTVNVNKLGFAGKIHLVESYDGKKANEVNYGVSYNGRKIAAVNGTYGDTDDNGRWRQYPLNATFTWKNGNLVAVHAADGSFGKADFTVEYTSQKNYGGAWSPYRALLEEGWYDVLYYAGLLGESSEYLPSKSSSVYTDFEDGGKEQDTTEYSYEFYPTGQLMRINSTDYTYYFEWK